MKSKQTTNYNFTWNQTHQQLLGKAQAGDDTARNQLFNELKVFLEMVHCHTQDGQYPSKFSNTFNFNGREFEEASDDVFEVFKKCVQSYDASYKVPFGAYLVGELKLRAMDWVRNRKDDRLLRVGQTLDKERGIVLDEGGFEKACGDYYAEISGDCCDEETHPVEYVENMDLVKKIFETVMESGNEKLIKFLDEYYEYGLEKNGMEVVADHMDVGRTAPYNYLKQVRELLRPKFGEFFANAA
ncbi:MAG: hypothetical protein MJY85_05945 [Fibrobacter sp.]|nr:hypothetical protein [Fibrobacter sp.]